MTEDLKLVNITTQDFGSAKDMELHDVRWEKMSKNYWPLLSKAGLVKLSKLKVWNEINKYRYIHIFEYKSKESYENCQPIWKKVENELFHFLTMPIVFLSHFYKIYVETAFHLTVPLRPTSDNW